jgi:bacteriocin-like protein
MTTPHTGKSLQNAAPSTRQDQNRTWHAAIELTEQELKRVIGGGRPPIGGKGAEAY